MTMKLPWATAAAVLALLLCTPLQADDAGKKDSSPSGTATSSPELPRDFGAGDLGEVEDFGALDLAALLDMQVETASRHSEPISRAPAIIEVLTRQQILNLGARNLYEALTFLPGIEVIESYFGVPTFVFRGNLQEIYNAKVLLLINGHPNYDPLNSTFYLEQVPLEAIQRIEVIRGPGSVLYGTNAFAGVINIITATRQEDSLENMARLEAGSFGTVNGGAGHIGRSGDLTWGVFASGQYDQGYPYVVELDQNEDCVLPGDPVRPEDCAPPGPSATFDYYNRHASFMGDVAYKGLRLNAGYMTQDRQKYGPIPVVRFHGNNRFQRSFVNAEYAHDWQDFEARARFGLTHDRKDWVFANFPLPQFEDSTFEASSRLWRGELSGRWYARTNVFVDAGVSYELGQSVHLDMPMETGGTLPLFLSFDELPSLDTLAGYTQLTWRIGDQVTLLAGNRVSRFQTEQARVTVVDGVPEAVLTEGEPIINISPRGGVVYTPTDQLAFKLLYGEAFRAPNFFETSAVLNQIIGVADNIQPETIRTVEFGVDSRPLAWLSARANVYYSLIDDFIGRRPPTTEEVDIFGATATVFDNLPRRWVSGVEVSFTGILSDEWSFFTNADVKRVRDADGEPIYGSSPVTVNGGVSYRPFDWLAVRPNAQYFGARGAASSYVLANTVLDFPVTDVWTISLIGTNLLDADYDYPEYVRGIVDTVPGGPGRAYYARLTAAF